MFHDGPCLSIALRAIVLFGMLVSRCAAATESLSLGTPSPAAGQQAPSKVEPQPLARRLHPGRRPVALHGIDPCDRDALSE
jgi:hypothetical protein